MVRKKKKKTEDISCKNFHKIEKGRRFPEVTEEQKKTSKPSIKVLGLLLIWRLLKICIKISETYYTEWLVCTNYCIIFQSKKKYHNIKKVWWHKINLPLALLVEKRETLGGSFLLCFTTHSSNTRLWKMSVGNNMISGAIWC